MEKLPKTSPFFVKKKRRAEFLTQEVARFKSWWCFGFCFGFCRFFACFFHGNFNRCSGTTPQWLPTELLPCRALEKGRVGLWTILTRIVHTYMMHIYIYTHNMYWHVYLMLSLIIIISWHSDFFWQRCFTHTFGTFRNFSSFTGWDQFPRSVRKPKKGL